jgi:hypothetical protein
VRTLGKVALVVALAAVGAVVGLVGAFVHDASVEVLGVRVPVGLLVALGLAAATYALVAWTLHSRLAVLACGLGWLLSVFVLSVRRSEGDLVVGANLPGFVFLLGGSVLIGLGIALPYGNRTPPRPVP